MNFFKISAIAISIVLLMSCQKDELFENPGPKAPRKSSTDIWPAAANSQNPYEHLAMGIYHNHALNYYRDQRPLYDNQEQWMNDMEQITLDFFCATGDQSYCDPGISVDELAAVADTALNDSLWIISIEVLPVVVRAYIDKIWQVFDDYPVSNYPVFKDELVKLEAAIAADDSMSEDQLRMLLCATQVARYSAYYWKEGVANDFADWSPVVFNMNQEDMARVTKFDIKGSIAGYSGNNSLKRSAKGGPVASGKKSNHYIQAQ